MDSVFHYGEPLGYCNYNEGLVAVIGHWGPWGAAALFPYALCGKIYVWTALNAMTVANISVWHFSVLLAKPTNCQIILLILGYMILFLTLGYFLAQFEQQIQIERVRLNNVMDISEDNKP